MARPDKGDTTRKILSSPLLRRASKPEIPKKIIQIRAMDFTVWNGAKFGFGLCAGAMVFVIIAKIGQLLAWTLMQGLMSIIGG
jgi:hypothetical protein